jgi:signal peptidase I
MSQPVAANYITARENSLKILHTQADNRVATRVPKQNALQNGVHWLVMLAIFAILAHCWLVEPYVVTSGSMAPTLLGQHRRVTCFDCGLPFDVGSQADNEPLWTEARAICSNCGAADNPLANLPDTPGDGLLVFRGAFQWRAPRRWEPVVFRGTDDRRDPVVKRVIGLPGETIELVHGNVIVDGTLARKPLDAQRAMAILVNDDRYRPHTAQRSDGALIRASCWQPRDEQVSGWTFEPGKFRYRPPDKTPTTAPANAPLRAPSSAPLEIDWIDFHPWQRRGASQGSREPTSVGVNDHYAYNQSRPILELHAVGELLLRCELKILGNHGNVCFRANDGDHIYEVSFSMHKRPAIFSVDGTEVFAERLPWSVGSDWVCCEISTIDQQFLCAIDGELLFPPFELPETLPINSQAAPHRFTEGCFSIGATAAEVDVRSAQVFRDIYYTQLPEGFAAPAQSTDGWHVGAEALFVLGDNSPFSQDSRVTSEPGVPISQLIGRPLLVHAPRRAFHWGSRQWNLLDLSRVRGVR